MDEFEIMRQQLASMKQQLDSQKIVNKELMCKVMTAKTSWLNRIVTANFIIIPIAFLLFAVICHNCGISQWYSITFLVCGIIDAMFDIRTVRIPADIFSSCSMIDLKKFLTRQKKERMIQTCISGAFSVIWIMLFFYAMHTSSPTNVTGESFKEGGIIGAIIGGVPALIIIAVIFKKMQRTNDELLNEIDKFDNEA